MHACFHAWRLNTGVVNILDRIGHNAVIHLSETAVRFSVLNENVDGVHVFSELVQVCVLVCVVQRMGLKETRWRRSILGILLLLQDQLFSDYRIESQSNNCILFQISLENFLRALGSGKTAPTCQIKLVKRDGRPCLAVEARVSLCFFKDPVPCLLLTSF